MKNLNIFDDDFSNDIIGVILIYDVLDSMNEWMMNFF